MHYVLTVVLVVAVLAALGLLDFGQSNTSDVTDTDPVVSTSTVATSSSDVAEDPYADWKTYQNDDVGYELQHPSELSAETATATSDLLLSNDDETAVLDITTQAVSSHGSLNAVLSEETSRLDVVTNADIGTSTARVGGRLAGGDNQEVKILIADQVIIARLTFSENAFSADAAAAILDSLRVR